MNHMVKHTPFLAAAVLLLLSSCHKEPGSAQGDLPMHLVPTLAGDTKGSLTTADLTDFQLQVVSDDPAFSYFVRVEKGADGAWTAPLQLRWKNETASVSYGAARFGDYAFTEDDFRNGVDLSLPNDQGTQEKLNAADLLTMPAASKKFTDTADGTLPVALSHGLARVTFTLTLGPDFYDNFFTRKANPVKDFTVEGTNVGFNFKPQTGAVSVTADTKADITPLPGAFTPGTPESKNATATFESILVPQAMAAGALKVTFQVGSYYYEWSNADAITLVAGKTYDLAVSAGTSPVGQINGHQFVDMGGGLKWATCNVGAENPWDYGDYFAWGETTPKDKYSWDTYKWGDGNTFTKYTVGGTTVLEAADDAAAANWGANWRMPTDAEWTWLRTNCIWLWTTQNDVNGMLVTSKVNDNQVFLPAAGSRGDANLRDDGSFGNYWSSSLVESYSAGARLVLFDSGGVYGSGGLRHYGQSVRPVSK